MSKFDALELPVDQPSRMTILHPVTNQPLRDADGNEAYIDLLSLESAKARAFEREITDRRLSRRGRGNLTAQELEAEAVDRLATVTAGWRLLTLDGAPINIDCSPANARELYGNNRMAWLREQVEGHLANRANFSKASSAS